MTAAETKAIAVLHAEVVAYHLEIREHIIRCESCRGDVMQIATDLYGKPGDKDTSPGLLGQVANLQHSRRTFSIGLRCVWAVLLLVGGAIAAFLGG